MRWGILLAMASLLIAMDAFATDFCENQYQDCMNVKKRSQAYCDLQFDQCIVDPEVDDNGNPIFNPKKVPIVDN